MRGSLGLNPVSSLSCYFVCFPDTSPVCKRNGRRGGETNYRVVCLHSASFPAGAALHVDSAGFASAFCSAAPRIPDNRNQLSGSAHSGAAIALLRPLEVCSLSHLYGFEEVAAMLLGLAAPQRHLCSSQLHEHSGGGGGGSAQINILMYNYNMGRSTHGTVQKA